MAKAYLDIEGTPSFITKSGNDLVLGVEGDNEIKFMVNGRQVGGIDKDGIEALPGTVNVKAYGATGDGVTNDTAAINTASAALSAAGGGILYYPPGTYIAQGIDLYVGVSHVGAGGNKALLESNLAQAVTKIKAPSSPAVMTPMFRFAKGTAFGGGGEFAVPGINFKDMVISGRLNNETHSIPASVSLFNLIGVDFRTWQKQTCSFTGGGSANITATAHGLAVGDEVQFDALTTATIPTIGAGTFYTNFTYTVATVPDANTFTLSGVTFTNSGSGQFYVGKSLKGLILSNFEYVQFRNCDIGLRGGYLFDSFRITNCEFVTSWVGFCTEEQPYVYLCQFQTNHVAITGRILDCNMVGNYISGNDYGIVPFGSAGVWGNTFGAIDVTRSTNITNSLFSGSVFYKNKILAIGIGAQCTVSSCEIVSDKVAYADSVGVRVNGIQCCISDNQFGEGRNDTSFGRCAIALDIASNAQGTVIADNTFRLAGCPAVQGTDIANSLYGSGNIGARTGVSIIANTLYTDSNGDRLVHILPSGSTVQGCQVSNNLIYVASTGTSGVMGTTDGYIEAWFFSGNIISNNILIKASANRLGQFILKQKDGLDASSVIRDNICGSNAAVLTETISLGSAGGAACDISGNWPSAVNRRGPSVYASGTVYTLTASQAKVDFGTTDPGITLTTIGSGAGVATWRLRAGGTFKYTAATFAASQTFTVVLRRTNNTAANISNATMTVNLAVVTTATDGFQFILPEVLYTSTATGGDTIEMQASVSALPSAGSVQITEAWITAERE